MTYQKVILKLKFHKNFLMKSWTKIRMMMGVPNEEWGID